MIVKKARELTPYELYFTEAPRRKRRPRRVLTARPDGRLKNFADNIDPMDEEEPEDDGGLDLVDDSDFDANIEDEMMDIPEDEIEAEDDTGGEDFAPVEPEEDIPEDEPAPEGEEPTVATDVPAEDAPADTGDGGLDTGDDTGADDFDANIDGGDGETGDEGMDDTGADNAPADTGGDGTAPENNLDNQLKYALFRNMKDLYLAVQSYQDRLDSITPSSFNYNYALKTVSTKLADLEDMMFEYMTIKFKDADYIASMDFYQKCLSAVLLIFQMVDNNRENLKDNDKTIN